MFQKFLVGLPMAKKFEFYGSCYFKNKCSIRLLAEDRDENESCFVKCISFLKAPLKRAMKSSSFEWWYPM